MSRAAHLFLAAALAANATACGMFFQRAKPSSAPVDVAPPFELADEHGRPVALEALLASGQPVVLVFYRGFW